MATTFWLLMGYNFGCMIASIKIFTSRNRFSQSSYQSSQSRFWGSTFPKTIFGFLHMGCTSVPFGEYACTVRLWRQCGLM